MGETSGASASLRIEAEKLMDPFAGLYPYEIVLMLLGVALFLVLLISLLRNVFKDKPYSTLLPAFLLPLTMIGYPSVQSIKYGNLLVQVQAASSEAAADPSNQSAISRLADLKAQIEPRAMNDAQGMKTLEEARNILDRQPGARAGAGSHASPNPASNQVPAANEAHPVPHHK
jgi:hypothetical protein